jgi:hypothetical protein
MPCLLGNNCLVLFSTNRDLANKIPSTQTWTIAKAICDALSHVVKAYVINQNYGY